MHTSPFSLDIRLLLSQRGGGAQINFASEKYLRSDFCYLASPAVLISNYCELIWISMDYLCDGGGEDGEGVFEHRKEPAVNDRKGLMLGSIH